MATTPLPPKRKFTLSEDWQATLIGVAIVLIIGFGVLGAGPQTVRLTAAAGETQTIALLPISGWSVSAALDGATIPLADAPRNLTEGSTYLFTCANGTLTADPNPALQDVLTLPPAGRAQLLLVNDCAGEVTITYRTSAAIRWPLFNLFSR